MTRRWLKGMVVGGVCWLALPASGQEPGEPGPEPERDRAGMRDTMRILFVDAARRELGLSDEQALKLLPLVDRLSELREAPAA